MKNILKIFVLFIGLIMFSNSSFAISTGKIEKQIKSSGLEDAATVAVSIRNAKNGDVIYEQNSKKLLHPASTLKLFTLYSELDTLGYEYFYKTGFYTDNENNLYIKLGADPLLTTAQLKGAIQKVKETSGSEYKNLYIDDSIIDKKEFADGWIWDDEINPYTPKVSSYNLDGNVVKAQMSKNAQGLMDITLKSKCPMSVISYIKADAKKDALEINRYAWQSPEVVEIYGYVKSPVSLFIPVSSPRRYFIYNLEKIIDEKNIKISNTSFTSKILPPNAKLIDEISNPIKTAIPLILHDSNNLIAESTAKITVSKKYGATGTTVLFSKYFKEFYNKLGLDTDNIVIADGCGVSRKNLISADWMSNALNKIYNSTNFEQFKENMAQAGEGTLSERLYNLRGEAWLKTGSLSNISAIAGFVKSQDGNTYSVVLIEQNFTKPQKEIKAFEDEIIKLIYSR